MTFASREGSQINSSLKVLLGFSTFPFCLMTDLSPVYRLCKTGKYTNSCRVFWWFLDANDVSMFGDKPSGNIFGQELSHIAMDHKLSEKTRQLIFNHFNVDDGLTSSDSNLMNIKNELPGTFAHYSFVVK